MFSFPSSLILFPTPLPLVWSDIPSYHLFLPPFLLYWYHLVPSSARSLMHKCGDFLTLPCHSTSNASPTQHQVRLPDALCGSCHSSTQTLRGGLSNPGLQAWHSRCSLIWPNLPFNPCILLLHNTHLEFRSMDMWPFYNLTLSLLSPYIGKTYSLISFFSSTLEPPPLTNYHSQVPRADFVSNGT